MIPHRSPPRLQDYDINHPIPMPALLGPSVETMQHEAFKKFGGRRLEFRQAREVAVCNLLLLYGFKRQPCSASQRARSGNFKAWAVYKIVQHIQHSNFDNDLLMWKYIIVPVDASLNYWLAAAKRLDQVASGRAFP